MWKDFQFMEIFLYNIGSKSINEAPMYALKLIY